MAVGHSHPRLVKAVQEQVAQLPFCHSSAYTSEVTFTKSAFNGFSLKLANVKVSEELATRLCNSANMERAIFLTSGTEAIETSVKLAYQYHAQRGQPQRDHFIARKRSYHGNSITALSLGHDELRGAPFKRILSSKFHHVSPAYAYRGQRSEESERQYVERLASELEHEIVAVGADRIAAFYAETGKLSFH